MFYLLKLLGDYSMKLDCKKVSLEDSVKQINKNPYAFVNAE